MRKQDYEELRGKIILCVKNRELLTNWEKDFIYNIEIVVGARKNISIDQKNRLQEIINKIKKKAS